MERGIIDRIEGSIAVVETENGMKNMPIIEGIHEGDCILYQNDKIISVDYEETSRRKALILEKFNKLKNK